MSSLLNLPPVLSSDEFQSGIHTDVSGEILNLIVGMARQSCNGPISYPPPDPHQFFFCQVKMILR